jgi:hypothetical protein
MPNKSFEKLSEQEEEIGRAIVNAAFRVHAELGPACRKEFIKFASRMN